MISDPILILILWLGRLYVVKELRNSVVTDQKWQLSSVSDLSTESTLRYFICSPMIILDIKMQIH